jgi:hypothetical protein
VPITVIRVDKSRRTGHVAGMGEMRNAYRILVGKPEATRPLGRSRNSWEDNIRTDLRERGWNVWTERMWFRIGTSSLLL